MNDTEVVIEFKWPWTMMPLELAGEWIEAVKKALPKSDPLYGKDIGSIWIPGAWFAGVNCDNLYAGFHS
jgi:hypothetical protein